MMTNDGAPYRESEIAEGEPDGEMSIEEWCALGNAFVEQRVR